MDQPLLFFDLVNVRHGVAVGQIEMTAELFENEVKDLIDPSTLTLKKLKYGDQYTIEPKEETEALVATLSQIFDQYQRYCYAFDINLSNKLSQADAMIEAVGLLFHTTKYAKVNAVKDLQCLIAPSTEQGHEVQTVEHSKLDMLIGKHASEMNIRMSDLAERYLKSMNDMRSKVGLPPLRPVEKDTKAVIDDPDADQATP